MKAIKRRILLEALGTGMGLLAMATIIFEAPRNFTFAYLGLMLAVAGLLRLRFRKASQDRIDEKTDANISAIGMLAFVGFTALMMFLKHSQRDSSEASNVIPQIEAEPISADEKMHDR